MNSTKLTWSNQYIPSRQSMMIEQQRHSEYNRLGIDISTFSDVEMYSKDELIAMKCILNNKPVPTEVEKRLLETKEQRISKRMEKRTPFNLVTDGDIAKLIN